MMLVVDMNWKRDSLAQSEFVLPIVSAVSPFEECVVKHFLDVDASEIGSYSCIVLSGNALKDFEAQKHLDSFNWIKTCNQPLLGVCAGMQILSQVYAVPLTACLQVGMTEITTLKENPLFRGSFQAYTLHSLSVTPSETFEVLAQSTKGIQAIKHKQKPQYGVLFHPEVRNLSILHNFTKL
jgi:GMP synthase-like glutamine amidotransferase